MRFSYRSWLEATFWSASIVFWFFFSDPHFPWWQPLFIWLGFICLFLITKKSGHSPLALPFVAVLSLLGWVFLYRLQPFWAGQQFGGILLGFCAYLGGLFVPLSKKDYSVFYGGAGLVLLLLTLFFGQRIGGAKAWLALGNLRFQPVEFARILLVLFFASLFTEQERGKGRLGAFALLSAVFLILALQKDLGPALLLFLVVASLSLYLSFSWPVFFSYLGISVAGFYGCLFFFPHLRGRVTAWFWPWDYLDTEGYQVLQGLFAFRAGGVLGQGIGAGLVEVIPAAHTDYLFAVIGEEMGLLGTFSLVLIFVALAFWGFSVLKNVKELRTRAIGLGLILLFHFQILLVLGGMLRFFPFTGMTLPFISFGTSSLLAQFWMLGILTGLGAGKP